MVFMDEKEIDKLAKLCRISCTPEEKEQFSKSIGQVLAYIDQLKEIDTEGAAPCYTVLETLANVLREDVPGEILSRDAFLANASSHVGGMVRVPPVMKQG